MRDFDVEDGREGDASETERVPVDEVLRLLHLIGAAQLPAESWTRVGQALGRLEEETRPESVGFPAEDVQEVEKAASGPRIVKAGSAPPVSAPAPVRERLNKLIHTLSERGEGNGRPNDDGRR